VTSSISGRRWTYGLFGLLLLAAAWQVAAMATDKVVFPTLTASLAALRDVGKGDVLTGDVLPSIYRVLAGFAISGVLGAVLGVLTGYFRLLDDWVSGVVAFVRALPFPLLLPLAIVITGIGNVTIVSLIVLGSIWPVYINAYDGTRAIDPLSYDVVKICGLSKLQMFRRVIVPSVLPAIFSGLRVALGFCLAVMVVAEMLTAPNGIGHFLVASEQTFAIAQTFAGVIAVGIIGFILDSALLFVERFTLRHMPAS
jgi:sulfonate transport system permease protein